MKQWQKPNKVKLILLQLMYTKQVYSKLQVIYTDHIIMKLTVGWQKKTPKYI